ncbi:MAG: type II toxin-antitoxin system VapC family toxin [Chloroflexi bacterium]|nr:type II toxin-antitoxin system VapC family toxin [Chloroflexota bacterium]
MNSVFIDVNIPMYAAGRPHPLRKPSQEIIRAIVTNKIEAVTDAEVFQEILYRYWHIREHGKGLQIFDHFYRIMRGRILPVEDQDVLYARDLSEAHPSLRPRDLVHLAIMLRHRIGVIITADTDFDNIPEIRRIDPLAFSSYLG